MRLEKLEIEGFRSLYSVRWEPGPMNVWIGPNAGGKSNFLDALELLRAAATGEFRDAVFARGGMIPLLWDGRAERIRFSLTTDGNLTYSLSIRPLGPTSEFRVTEESVRRGSEELLTRDWADMAEAAEPGETILATRFGPDDPEEPRRLQQWLRRWEVHYDLRTDRKADVRRSAPVRRETRLSRDGGNLVQVLHTLYTTNEEFERRLDDALAAAFPDDYVKLKFAPLEEGRIELRLRWKHSARPPAAADLSDGTLRFLMLAAILANPEPAPLIAIDEPETGLHPRMLAIVAELAEEAASKSQVILATHSPELLDAFHEEPPAVTVFRWEKDRTVLSTLAGVDLKRWVEDYSLGKFAFSGEAEALS